MTSPISFSLFAPYNKEVSLVGSFSDWQPIEMELNQEGYFCTEVPLEDGEYEYQFRLRSKSWFLAEEEWTHIVDPYATRISDDKQNAVLLVHDGHPVVDLYTWRNDHLSLPDPEKMVIYELHPRDFAWSLEEGESVFMQLHKQLDTLVSLGVNAIECMPVFGFPGEYSWGYNPQHMFALDPTYGRSEHLKSFIDTCHEKGIRFILDCLYHHVDQDAPLTKIDYEYWFHREPKSDNADHQWGPEFNYHHHDEHLQLQPAWKMTFDHAAFWIQEYHIDGVRYDALKHIEHLDFIEQLTAFSREKAGIKPFYQIAEHIPENPEICGWEKPFDSCWHESYRGVMVQHLCEEHFDSEALMDIFDPRRKGFTSGSELVNYLSNHDQERMIHQLGEKGILDQAAYQRLRMAYTLLMTSLGTPMLWMGEEFGEFREKSIDPSPLHWELLEQDAGQSLFSFLSKMIHWRKENPALYRGEISFFEANEEHKVFGFLRHTEEQGVVVVANFSDVYYEAFTCPHFPAGTWTDPFSESKWEVAEGFTFPIAPWTCLLAFSS